MPSIQARSRGHLASTLGEMPSSPFPQHRELPLRRAPGPAASLPSCWSVFPRTVSSVRRAPAHPRSPALVSPSTPQGLTQRSLSWANSQSALSSRQKCPIPSPNVLPPSEAAFLDPVLKTTWVGPSGGARAWQDNLLLLCNHARAGHHSPASPQGTSLLPWPGGQSPVGGPGRGRAGREIRAEATGDQVVPRGGNEMAPATRAVNKGSQTGCRGPVPGVWELGSRGRVFVFSVIISLLFPVVCSEARCGSASWSQLC